jgi:hypothetical protein
MDCERCERELLDPERVPALAGCDVIVESHDFSRPDITPILTSRFAMTHRIDRVDSGARDPNTIDFLQSLPDHIRWIPVMEWRPMTMHWLRMLAYQK